MKMNIICIALLVLFLLIAVIAGYTDMDKADFEEFLEECRKRSLYDTGITAEYGDELLTLSTCEYSHENGRFVVVAKRIQEGS